MSIINNVGLTRNKIDTFRIGHITLVCPNCQSTGKGIVVEGFRCSDHDFYYWLMCKKCACKFSIRKDTVIG